MPDLANAGLSSIFGSIDPTTRALIEKSTQSGLSTEARLQQQHKEAVQSLQNALAARGIYHSGETGVQLGRENQEFTRSQYDANQKLLDYFAGLQAAFAQGEKERHRTLADQAGAAAGRVVQQYPASAPQQASWGGYGPDGRPYWTTPDGRRWNQDGSPYAPTSSAAPAPTSSAPAPAPQPTASSGGGGVLIKTRYV